MTYNKGTLSLLSFQIEQIFNWFDTFSELECWPVSKAEFLERNFLISYSSPSFCDLSSISPYPICNTLDNIPGKQAVLRGADVSL